MKWDAIVVGGLGEVGNAIVEIEKNAKHSIDIVDIGIPIPSGVCDVLHICIPYSDEFVGICEEYITRFKPLLVIIHSTLKVGTTRQIKEKHSDIAVVYSPIRGVHPKLIESIYTFVKYVGGNKSDAKKAIKYLHSLDVDTEDLGDYETTELAKLLSTSYYGWCIAFADIANKECQKHGVDYNKVYTEWNETYNLGYSLMGEREVIRPILYPPAGVVGGHCIRPNLNLLGNKLLYEVIHNIK